MTPEQREALVERMARAIHDELYKDSPEDWRQDDYEFMRAQFIREARAALSIAEEEIESGWRERELDRIKLLETAFEKYDSGEITFKRLRNACLLLWSAPTIADVRAWAAGEVERLSSRGE